MYCPLCGAEYRPGFTVCSDCQISLVPDPPIHPEPLADRPAGDTLFALAWSGSDPRKHAEICEALERQKIPQRTLRREDHLFNPTAHADLEVYVPVDLMSSALQAINEAAATDALDQLAESGSLEIPAEDDAPNGDPDDDDRVDLNRDPQDATVEIWSGQDADMATMITSALRENRIFYRTDSDRTESESPSDEMHPATVFVFPENEQRSKAIVREIVDAVPPQ
jgi:hypothetical protein